MEEESKKKRRKRRRVTRKINSRFRSLTGKKLQSELKTHDEEIASMKQEHWAKMQRLWEEMMR